MGSIVVLICVSLMTVDVEHFFKVLVCRRAFFKIKNYKSPFLITKVMLCMSQKIYIKKKMIIVYNSATFR